MAILVDTGILYALADADDAWHGAARAWVETTEELLLVPVTVLPEVTYLLRARLGADAERRFVESIAAEELTVEPLMPRDLARAADVLGRFPGIGFVDASVVAMAERLRIATLATTDRRHFGAMRPQHVAAFDLVPAALR